MSLINPSAISWYQTYLYNFTVLFNFIFAAKLCLSSLYTGHLVAPSCVDTEMHTINLNEHDVGHRHNFGRAAVFCMAPCHKFATQNMASSVADYGFNYFFHAEHF
jgi:hypothetical protein